MQIWEYNNISVKKKNKNRTPLKQFYLINELGKIKLQFFLLYAAVLFWSSDKKKKKKHKTKHLSDEFLHSDCIKFTYSTSNLLYFSKHK